jgi:hypothetical protein
LPALIAWLLLLRWRRELHGLRPAAAAYAQLGILARWAGLPQRAHTTPFEYGNELVRALPRQRAFIARIIRAYVGERYRREVHSRSFAPELRQLRQPLLRRMVARLTGGVRPPQARRHSRRQR